MAKHQYYDFLNLLGYGLAKFNMAFVEQFGFENKSAFYRYFVDLKLVETTSVIKNRMDLFDPFFDNGRKGWWQKAEEYRHRKDLIDSLFGQSDVKEYADIVKVALKELGLGHNQILTAPLSYTKFKKLQETGLEAEQYFLNNYRKEAMFQNGKIEDARLYGDGYDFQISTNNHIFLAEVKGIRANKGKIRLTEKEFLKAKEFTNQFVLSLVMNLETNPRLLLIENPLKHLEFKERITQSKEIKEYHLVEDVW